jgi:hypothetical protein
LSEQVADLVTADLDARLARDPVELEIARLTGALRGEPNGAQGR